MNIQLLIESIVRQTTVLIAQLATSGGVRAPLAHIANQVFTELARELENQGLNRKVAADMFGVSLRTYRRKMQRLKESSTDSGRSLWEAVISYLEQESIVTRHQILERFHRDDEVSVRGILRDLVESGFVFCSGMEKDAVFRIATKDELETVRRAYGEHGLNELVWAIIFNLGPISYAGLAESLNLAKDRLDSVIDRLIAEGRVQVEQRDNGRYFLAEKLFVPLGAQAGWEASVYDHFHAMVQTICNRLNREAENEKYAHLVGGSTYQFDLGAGHPMAREVLNTLSEFRERCSGLRKRVVAYNQEHGLLDPIETVTVYAGQSVIPKENGNENKAPQHEGKGK